MDNISSRDDHNFRRLDDDGYDYQRQGSPRRSRSINRGGSRGDRRSRGRSRTDSRRSRRDDSSRSDETYSPSYRSSSKSTSSYSPSPDVSRRARKRRRREERDFQEQEPLRVEDEGQKKKRRGPRRRRRRRRKPRKRSVSPRAKAGVVSVEDEQHQTRRPSLKEASRPTQKDSKPHDDTVGHFEGGKGTVVADRYKILREVGLGTFGRVVECLDLMRNKDKKRRDNKAFVALKIVRNIKRYYESALIEARIVESVNRRGGRGLSHCVVLHDSFSFKGYYCMVFESLGPSLYDFLKRNGYRPFPMACVQGFTVQLLEALEFLHSFRLIHTDLKIENILLVNDREVTFNNQRVPESTRIKLIDFGGACYDSDKKSSIINTRQYRAPEVILGTGWSMPSDMWSAGCILAELYQGELLFATHDTVEHLGLMERIIGPFPRAMVRAAKTNGMQISIANKAFDSDGRHRMERVLPSENASFVRNSPRLEHLIRNRDDIWFMDLLRKILVIDPTERSTAYECLHFLTRIRRADVRYNMKNRN